ncbi:ATP-binding protein [Intestinimonas massiliensis (ex Afouda et al. 2020)]|uniref:ATP-binding protein n=1 Tax=Intestinimonas massiliensis (ex Afouda et al. 2020) TaxID=1673721 RepID=UPI00102FEA8A|nr:ATP-binding protein [Intestinimonas massiliensis (ex Afouda et al. 2020)]
MKEIALYTLDIAQNSITAQARHLDITLSEEGNTITLTIADDGKGMSRSLLATVSDPFTTTRTTRKMGLGLPLLRMAAEQTGGSLLIESQLGVGTTVKAVFQADHIDCPPVGDMAGSITLLLQGAPELELTYTHRAGEAQIGLATSQLRQELGDDISLAEPEVILWVRDYLQEQEALLRENKGMKA